MYTEEEALSHYGVKGMRWGVRRTDEQLARARAKRKGGKFKETPKNVQSKDAKVAKAAESKVKKKKKKPDDLSALSNDELKVLLDRMQLEQRYNNLSGNNKNQTSLAASLKQGQKMAKTVASIGDSVNDIVKFASSPLGQQLKKELLNR